MFIDVIKKKRLVITLKVFTIVSALFVIQARALGADTRDLPEVTATKPIMRPLKEWDDYVGRFVASQTVEVRPRVSGLITERKFNDGDNVEKGKILFVIDQRPFIAALAAAKAEEAKAESALTLARADLTRAQRLVGDESLSASEIDALKAQVSSAVAQKDISRADVVQKSLDLEWTTVRAPTSGRISDRRVDVGNLVLDGSGSATLLTTINVSSPIYFVFDASESLFLKSLRLNIEQNNKTEVQVKLQDEHDYIRNGTLDFIDNGLDPRSGTIRLRATFPNIDGFLTPGMFGNMRMAVGSVQNLLMVPDEAVQTSQTRKTVLVVSRDSILIAKPVTTGALIDGMRIIKSGISKDDDVVTAGLQMVSPGTKVKVDHKVVSPVIQATSIQEKKLTLSEQKQY